MFVGDHSVISTPPHILLVRRATDQPFDKAPVVVTIVKTNFPRIERKA